MKKLLHIFLNAAFFLSAAFGAASSAQAAPPVNFQTEQIITDGLDGPSGFEIAPDGRIFVLQRTGEIRVIKNGQLLEENFAVLPSAASGDRGLIGIAFDPEFGIANHYVYFYYTGLDKLNRLVRFDASEDVGQNGPYLIYQTTFLSENLHVGGSIRFGPDGKMYFAVGDNGYPPNAQNLANPHGKILRINKDGSIPLDNPFVGQPNALPEIWAYGFRNPWRFQFDSATGKLYGGDVGDFTWEEVNHIQKGKNYGWPTVEGMCTTICGTMIDPIYAYNHDGQSSAVTGGPVYRHTMFPEEYQGNLFFGDYARGFIKRAVLDEFGNATAVHDFDVNAGSVVDLKVAPDGSLYYITYWPGRLYRVSYTTGNHIPTANATADDLKGTEPHTVNFSSAGSFDPDGDPITYLWEFGDGTTSTLANPTKTYHNKGTYTVELTVNDGTYSAHAVPLAVQVGIPPTVTIYEPTDGTTYRSGDTIHYTVFGLDGAGFDIDDRNLKTEIILHHNTHVHPFLGPIIGRQGTFTIPTTGEASADTWYEIKTTATDTNGLATTESRFIQPIKSNFTIKTEPAGLQISLDGVPKTGEQTIQGVVGFERELNAPTTQIFNNTLYEFDHWSDNQSQKHFFTTQETHQTYTAHFKALPSFSAEFFDNQNLSGDPIVTRLDPVVNFNWVGTSPDPDVPDDHFSARWTKTAAFEEGIYEFSITGDDGVRVKIDGVTVINAWLEQSQVKHTVQKNLSEGNHTIVVEYYENGGDAMVLFEYEKIGDGTYSSQYFNNKYLSGAPVLTRNDATVNFDWGLGSPDATINNDNFSARFTKAVDFSGGEYEFTVTGDDGVRLYIDNQLLIDKWIDQSATTYKAKKMLSAGTHIIKYEYFESGGDAVAKLAYEQTGELPAPSVFSGEYFTNKTLTGTPALTRNETAIDFDWGGTSPDPAIPNDGFSARFTKTENLDAGVYTFTTTTDDGVRLIVDGETIIDKWINQGPTTYTATKNLTAGNHTIIMEYYEDGGGALARMQYEKTREAPVDGFAAEYFANRTLSGAPALTRNDDQINFDWGGGNPDASLPVDDFSVKWTKNETFEEGSYEFSITGDDGVRLYIDNELVVDKWINQSATTYKVTKNLTAGQHLIAMEYFENGGDAVAKLSYAKTTVTPPPTTAFAGEYFANKTLGGTPVLTRNDDAINFDWGGTSPDSAIPNDGFSARWTKSENFAAGTYEFTALADDGVRVKVDGEIILDKWIDQSAPVHKATKTLTAGNHTIVMEYYENGGDAVAKLSYAPVTTTPPPAIGYQAEYFNNKTLTGPAVLSRNDATIDFDWAMGSPDATVNNDNFSVRWMRSYTFEQGTYRFTTTSDDGIRVYVDDELVLDRWIDQSPTTHTAEKTLTAGNHIIKVEYYENGGGALAKFNFEKVTTPPSPEAFTSEFYNTMDLSGPVVVSRHDDLVAFDWGQNAPDPMININHFSARFTQQKHFAAGSYTFLITADDGVRLFIDNQLVLDKWIDQSATLYTTTVNLTQGNHTIKIEYYENFGDAKIIFQTL